MKNNLTKLFAVILVAVMCIFAFASCKKDKEIVGNADDTTIIEKPTKKVEEYSTKEQLYALAGVLKNAKAYRSEINGTSTSSFHNQIIHDIHIKNGDESYLKALSTSALVKVGKEAYFVGDKVVVRSATDPVNDEWGDDYAVLSFDEYRGEMGGSPLELSNYILNEETIVECETVKEDDGTYTITASIDPELGTIHYAAKMKNYGRLSSLPTFTECTIVINFNNNFSINYIESKDEYKVSLLGLKVTCSSELKEEFEYPDKVEIPNASTFREVIGGDVTDNGTENKLTSEELLLKTFVEANFKNGVGASGTIVTKDQNGKDIVLPLNAWASIDLSTHGATLPVAIQGRIKLGTGDISTQVMYNGDGFLYVDVANTKYKYRIVEDTENLSATDTESLNKQFDEVVSMIEIAEKSHIGNIYTFEVKLKDECLEQINEKIAEALGKLPVNVEQLKNFKIESLAGNITMVEKDGHGHIESVAINCKTSITSFACDVLVAEKVEVLPTGDELSDYIEGTFDNLKAGFDSIGKLVTVLKSYDFKNGAGFVIGAGIGPTPLVTLNTYLQNNGGLKGYIEFPLGGAFGGPSTFFIENGKIYIATTQIVDGKVYATSIEEVDIMGALLSKLPSIKLPENTDLFAVLVDALLNSEVVSVVGEDGTVTTTVTLDEDSVKLFSGLYRGMLTSLIDNPDKLGPAGPMLVGFLKVFNGDVTAIRFKTVLKDEKVSNLSIELDVFSTTEMGDTQTIPIVLQANGFANSAEGFFDGKFEILTNGLVLCKESAKVRQMADKIKADGLIYLGDSFMDRITAFETEYNKLSDEAKKTVGSYNDVMKIKNDYLSYRSACAEFVEKVIEIEELDKVGGKEKEIADILTAINAKYKTFKKMQIEYLGGSIIDRYLEMRKKNEASYGVGLLNAEIDKLKSDNFTKSVDFDKAIKAMETNYNKLLKESQALVENYQQRVKLIKADLCNMQMNEKIAELSKLEKIDAETANNNFFVLKGLVTKYNAMSAEEKALIENFDAFNKEFERVSAVYRVEVEIAKINSEIKKIADDIVKVKEFDAQKIKNFKWRINVAENKLKKAKLSDEEMKLLTEYDNYLKAKDIVAKAEAELNNK